MLYVFHRERTSKALDTYRSCFLIPIESILLLLGSSNKGIMVRRSTISSVVPHQVHDSPISTVCLLQVHHSPISSVLLIKCTIQKSPQCAFYNCTVHQSPVLCLYKGCTNLHCCASIVAPFYCVAPFVSNYLMPSDYATRQFYIINNLATDVNTPCRLFNCIVEI